MKRKDEWGTSEVPPERLEREVRDEITYHIERRIDDNLRRGMSREDARVEAERRFGSLGLIEAEMVELGRRPPAEVIASRIRGLLLETLTDLELAARSVIRHARFTLLAILTLAPGIGAAAAIFGMLNQLLLRPLPGVNDEGRGAYLQLRLPDQPDMRQGPGQGFAFPTLYLDDLSRAATAVDGMALYGARTVNAAVGDARPLRTTADVVYGDFFRVLGVRPSEGRLLSVEETGVDAPVVAVISQGLRSSLFASETDVVGRTLRLNGQDIVVIGVAGGGFTGPERGNQVDVWLPYSALPVLFAYPVDLRLRSTLVFPDIVLRLRTGIAAEAAEAQIRQVIDYLATEDKGIGQYLTRMTPTLIPGLTSPPSWRSRILGTVRLLSGVVFIVLLISCANMANLVLLKNAKRTSDVATRRALGASSRRIALQHLFESLLLTSLGMLAGLAFAWLATLPFEGQSLDLLPAFERFSIDRRVFLFGGALTLLVTVLVGTVPALLASRADPRAALGETRGLETGRLGIVRQVVSAAQFALCLTLLVGGLLLIRTVRNLYAVENPLAAEDVWELVLGGPTVATAPRLPTSPAFYEGLLASAAHVPGVRAVALDTYGAGADPGQARIAPEEWAEDAWSVTAMMQVSAGWFDLMGVKRIDGAPVVAADWESAGRNEILVTSSLANHLFGRTDITGQRVRAGPFLTTFEIAGVTTDIRSPSAPDAILDTYFTPIGVLPARSIRLLVRGRPLDAGAAVAIRGVGEAAVPGQPIPDLVPLRERMDRFHAERRIFARLLGALAGVGLLLAAAGLYAVIAFSVSARRRELGIRVALGADGAHITRLLARHAVIILGLGIAAGMGGAWMISKTLASRLFGVTPLEPSVYAMAIGTLGLTACLACWFPIRAALRVDPVETLRST